MGNNDATNGKNWGTYDADKIPPDQLELLFEPNDNIYTLDPASGRLYLKPGYKCVYERMAEIGNDFILVAERGAGKTHILKLLGSKIEEHGGIVLEINTTKSSDNPYNRYPLIENHYRNQEISKDKIWQYVILEALERKLDPPYRQNIERAAKTVESYAERIKIRFTLSPDPSQQTSIEVGYTPPPLPDPDKLPADLHLEIERLERKVYRLIYSIGRQNPNKKIKRLNPVISRALPVYPSVYIIADKLDQEKSEKRYEEVAESLAGLVNAISYFNAQAQSREELLRRPNFKAIIALRAITFYHSVKPKLDVTLEDGDICELRWHEDALKMMMAQRILGNQKLDESPDAVMNRCRTFPPIVHYFGHEFKGWEFFFTIAGKRPRSIIALWEKCVNESPKYHAFGNFYQAQLEEPDLIRGMERYAIEKLPNDLNEEYIIEYKDIDTLLNLLSAKNKQIHRFLRRVDFLTLLETMLDEERKNNKAKHLANEWLRMSSEEILQILFTIGVVGALPNPPLDLDESWPTGGIYVTENRHLKINDYDSLIIRPAHWHHLTNIETEIHNRREYIETLYELMKQNIAKLNRKIISICQGNEVDDEVEYELGKYLVLSTLIRQYHSYPGPNEFRRWSLAEFAIRKSWVALQVVISPLRQLQTNSQMDDEFGQSILDSNEFSQINEFEIEFAGSLLKYKPTISNPSVTWVNFAEFQAKIKSVIYNGYAWYLRRAKRDGKVRWLEKFSDVLSSSEQSLRSIITARQEIIDSIFIETFGTPDLEETSNV